MVDVVDLTLDSDDEEQQPAPAALPPSKRPRLGTNNTFSSDVEIVQLPAKPLPPPVGRAATQEQDDVIITGDSGMQVWNKDMAHTRHQCGNHPFARVDTAANALKCDHCFCFVCDVKASECESWGTGAGPNDHCNAYDSVFWKNRKGGGLPAIPSAPGDGAVPGARDHAMQFGVFGGGMGGIDPYDSFEEGSYSEDEGFMDYGFGGFYDDFFHHRAPRVHPPLPPLQELPAPDPKQMFHLGTAMLDVKALKGKTISEIQGKVVRWGAYTRNGLGKDPDADKVYIGNLTNHVSVLPFDVSLPPVPMERTVAVTIVHCDGTAAPRTYGVEMPSSTSTVKNLAQKAFCNLGMEDVPDYRWVYFSYYSKDHSEASYARRMGKLHTLTTRFRDEHIIDYCHEHQDRQLGIMLLASPGVPCKPMPADRAAAAAQTVRIVCFHRLPDKEGVHQIQGVPTVFNVDKKFAIGGKGASDALKKALLVAVRPFISPGKASSFTPHMLSGLLRAGPTGIYDRKYDYNSARYHGSNSQKPKYNKFSEPQNLKPIEADSIVYLCVIWKEAEDVKGVLDFEQPWAVSDSADQEKLKETWRRTKAEAERTRELAELKRRSMTIHKELTKLQGCSKPEHNRYQAERPLLRISMELQAKAGEPDKGTAVFQLWAWKASHGMLNGRPANDTLFSGTAAQDCQATMSHLLKDCAGVSQSIAEMKDWREDRRRLQDRSLPGFLKNLESSEMEAAAQPPGLTVTMRPYQLQSLGFMQRAELTNGNLFSSVWHKVKAADGTEYWYSPALMEMKLTEPERGPYGGFLCETMGLGKTIEVLALVLGDRPHLPPVPRVATTLYPVDHPLRQLQVGQSAPLKVEEHNRRICSNATLVICAVSLVGQWVDEATNKSAGSLRMYQYHGQSRTRDVRRLATEYDIVVTTYATLSKDYLTMLKKYGSDLDDYQASPLHGVHWYRIVLDESHTTKSTSAGHTKACMSLESSRRWCCSGTPVGTAIEDLYGQCCVLRTPLLSNQTFFNTRFKLSFGRGFGVDGNAPLLYYLMSKMMVRHTKNQKTGGETVLQLPPLEQEEVAVTFGASELEMYNTAHSDANNTFRGMAELGAHHVSKHLLQIMSLLLPMRRIASGGELSQRELTVPDCKPRRRKGHAEDIQEDSTLVVPAGAECPICLDAMEAPTVTPCAHWFCKECLLGSLYEAQSCPLCRTALQHDALRVAVTEAADASTPNEPQPEGPAAVCESKLQALLAELTAMRSKDGSAKALVFSQYMSTIEWLKKKLPENGFSFRTISGGMALKQRAKAIGDFQKDPPTTVFLLSMRAGAVGINLTAASHVFLLEPALNPSLEEQAIGRAWRMGQTRTVVVKKFYVKDSVEENIMSLVKSKQSKSGPQGQASEASTSRHQQQGLAGNLHADRQDLKLAELEMLFARHPPQETSAAAAN